MVGILMCSYIEKKNENTLKCYHAILWAIYLYHCECIETGREYKVSYEDMISYDRALWRLWDWSYKNIIPKEKFKIIAPYVNPHMALCFGRPITTSARAEYECDTCPFKVRCDEVREFRRKDA